MNIEALEERTLLAAFTAGDLVLLRVGDGVTPLDGSARIGALVELTTSGEKPASGENIIELPYFKENNQGGITFSGTSNTAAGLMLSADGRYLTTIGYDAALGVKSVAATPATGANRNVALIDSDGNVSIVARLTDAYSSSDARGVVTTDGSVFYTSGNGSSSSSNGLRYFTYSGEPATTSTQIVSGNLRQIGIIDGNLVFDDSTTLYQFSGLPEGETDPSNVGLSADPSTELKNLQSFIFLDRAPDVGDKALGGEVDTLYVASGPNGPNIILKFFWDGENWVAAGSTEQIAGGFFGLIGRTTDKGVELFATGNTGADNALYSFTDTTAYNEKMGGKPEVLTTAGKNYSFRGLAFAPTQPDDGSNAPPEIQLPAPPKAREDEPLIFSAKNGNAITISDPDAGDNQVLVNFTVGSGGVLKLASEEGLKFLEGENGSPFLTFTGTISAINAALDGLTFLPDPNYNGDASFKMSVNDLGNTGEGGEQITYAKLDFFIEPLNDAPANTVPGPQTTDEDTALVFSAATGNAISISDADASTSEVRVTLTATNGTLMLNGTTGLTLLAGANGSGFLTVSGTISAINAALDGLTFTPNADFNGAASLQIVTDDLGNTGSGGPLSDSDTIDIVVLAVNDAPTFDLLGNVTVDEDAGPQSVAVANFQPGPATATDEVGQTVLQYRVNVLNTTGNLAFTSAPAIDNSGNLTFTTAPDSNGIATIAVIVTDSAGASSIAQTFTVIVNALNDVPQFDLLGNVTIDEDAGPQSVSGFVSNLQPGPATATDELTQTIAPAVVKISNTTGNLVFSTAPALDASGSLSFTTAPDSNGTATIEVTYTDSAGASTTQTFTITVNAVDDAPPPVVSPPAPPSPPSPPVSPPAPPVSPPAKPPAAPAPPQAPPAPPPAKSPAALRLAQIIAVGSDMGQETRVSVRNALTRTVLAEFVPFAGFTGGAQTAVGDLNGDGIDEVIVATASGGAHVKVFSVSGVELQSFVAFTGYTGGLTLAAGDLNGDGRADIIVGTATGGSHVKVFDGTSSSELRSFLAFDGFRGGVRLAAGDVNGDGRADLALVAGPGGNGHIKVLDGLSNQVVTSFLAYAGFAGEINLAVGDLTGSGRAEILTVAPNPQRGAHVKAFSSSANLVRSFFAPASIGAAFGTVRMAGTSLVMGQAPRIATGNVTGDTSADILLSDPPGTRSSRLLLLDGATGAIIDNLDALDPLFNGGVYVDL